MTLSFATIHVRDLDAAVRFYEEVLSLKVMERFKPDEIAEVAFLKNEDSEFRLEFVQEKNWINVNKVDTKRADT